MNSTGRSIALVVTVAGAVAIAAALLLWLRATATTESASTATAAAAAPSPSPVGPQQWSEPPNPPSGQAVREPAPAEVSTPAWTAQDRAAAVKSAVTAMRLYARPQVPTAQWRANLDAVATDEFRADYAHVDPRYIPIHRPASTGTLHASGDNGYGATVSVATDHGVYTVQVLRSAAAAPWRVNTITPPLGGARK